MLRQRNYVPYGQKIIIVVRLVQNRFKHCTEKLNLLKRLKNMSKNWCAHTGKQNIILKGSKRKWLEEKTRLVETSFKIDVSCL
jgi:hypothetical protein